MSQAEKTDQAEVYSCPTELYKSDCAPPAEVEAHKKCVPEKCLVGSARSTFHAYLEPEKVSNPATARSGGPPRSGKSSRGGRNSRSKRSGRYGSSAPTASCPQTAHTAPSAPSAPTALSVPTGPVAPVALTVPSAPKVASATAYQPDSSSKVQWTGPTNNANDSDGEL